MWFHVKWCQTTVPSSPAVSLPLVQGSGVFITLLKGEKSYEKKHKIYFHKSLMIYHSTPLQTGLSPPQMLMDQHLHTNLPVTEELLIPKGAHKTQADKERGKQKQKQHYNKNRKELPVLTPGDLCAHELGRTDLCPYESNQTLDTPESWHEKADVGHTSFGKRGRYVGRRLWTALSIMPCKGHRTGMSQCNMSQNLCWCLRDTNITLSV